jgi:hypothetical protein
VARLYLDSDVSVRLAPLLREAGHDAATTEELGQRRATDDEQLLTAVREIRTVVTHNRRDFLLLHDAWRRWPVGLGAVFPAHAGILVLDHRLEPELAAALTGFLAVRPPAPLAGELYWWRVGSGWHRRGERRWEPDPSPAAGG